MRALDELETINTEMDQLFVWCLRRLAVARAGKCIALLLLLTSCSDGDKRTIEDLTHEPAEAAQTALSVNEAYYRLPPPGLDKSAAYLSINNPGQDAWRLISVSSDQVRAIEIHEIVDTEGQFAMRRRDEVQVPGGVSVELKPGGLHLMLFGLDLDRIESSQAIDLSLRFVAVGDEDREQLIAVQAPAVDLR